MINTQTKTNMVDLKNKIQARWGKLSDAELEGLNENMDQLTHKIQKVYGYNKEQAEKEFTQFKSSLSPDTSDVKAEKVNSVPNEAKSASACDSKSPTAVKN